MGRTWLAVVCIAGVVACSDDGSKGGGETQADGAVIPGSDAGGSNNIDSGLDGSLVGRDATVSADGAIVEPTLDSGTQPGSDSGTTEPACGNCDDAVDCTIDSCKNGKCEHRVDNNICAAGSSCDLKLGCQQGKACSSAMECADTDACTVNERCNPQTARCEHDILDRDGDGYPPASCGGTDCDDSRGTVNPSATETCNNRDDDCDGAVDDNLQPVTGYVCTMGQVQCATGYERCGGPNGFCVDLKTNHDSCGQCGNRCDSGETCEAGECKCTPGGNVMMCGAGANAACSDISKSQVNCGACGTSCAPVGTGGQTQSCIASSCAACGGENQVCCDPAQIPLLPNGCAPGFSCTGTAGAAGATCVCGAGQTKCDDACVDLKTDSANCGACGKQCEQGTTCVTAGGVTACQACGGIGEACCNVFGFGACRGGLTCGPDDTCVVANAGGNGGPGGM